MLSVYVNKKLIFPTDYTFSSVDPGGFESLSMSMPIGFNVTPGDEVRVFEGSETVWHGRIEDPGRSIIDSLEADQINAVGYGVKYKDNTLQLIYVDSDIGNFVGSPIDRRIQLAASNFMSSDASVDTAPTNGLPCVRTTLADTWASPVLPVSEVQYDAGFGNSVSRITGDWSVSSTIGTVAGGADFTYRWLLSTDSVFTSSDSVSPTGSSGSVNLSASTDTKRIASIQLFFSTTPGGVAGKVYDAYAFNIAIFGKHTLPIRSSVVAGTTVRGLALSELITDVVSRARTGFTLNVQYNPFLVRQAVYKVPTDFESIISDLSKYAGWHWGVWEPDNIASSTPAFHFRAPPASAERVCFLGDCQEIDITQSYGSIHDQIIVEYTDAYGKPKTATFSQPHPGLMTGDSHTLHLNMGVADDNAAATFARYALLLDQSTTRISGTTVLPLSFRDGTPSHLVKAGRDKIRIINFPFSKTISGSISERIDTFRVSRVTVNVSSGVARTTIEYDQGGDLIEVLQSQLSQNNATIGF